MSERVAGRDRIVWAAVWLAGWGLLSSLADSGRAEEATSGWKAGVARVVITPSEDMWMAGYAARNKPSEGALHDLYAKAVALQDPDGTRLVILTTDLIGIPRQLRDSLVEHVGSEHQLPPAALLLNASHTHCGPELRTSKSAIYGLAPERVEQSVRYYRDLEDRLRKLVARALEDLSPAELSYSHARAGFAMNRRLPTGSGFQNRPNPDGPVDHDVPVLQVRTATGELRAVIFGYACHNTTLGFYKFCGDYAGFAQYAIEARHPEATALFVAGCGGDQNPYPRRELEYAQQHGQALANSVEAALEASAKPLQGPLRVLVEQAALQFADPPTREQLLREAKSSNVYERRHAELLLEEFEESGEIETEYPYLVQVVRFGDELLLIALSGEVVVDYSLRFKTQFARGGTDVWVAGYSNDVMGYIPSLRVLQEGGYEGGGAMRYTRFPGPWAPDVEKRIVDKVHALVESSTARP